MDVRRIWAIGILLFPLVPMILEGTFQPLKGNPDAEWFVILWGLAVVGMFTGEDFAS